MSTGLAATHPLRADEGRRSVRMSGGLTSPHLPIVHPPRSRWVSSTHTCTCSHVPLHSFPPLLFFSSPWHTSPSTLSSPYLAFAPLSLAIDNTNLWRLCPPVSSFTLTSCLFTPIVLIIHFHLPPGLPSLIFPFLSPFPLLFHLRPGCPPPNPLQALLMFLSIQN